MSTVFRGGKNLTPTQCQSCWRRVNSRPPTSPTTTKRAPGRTRWSIQKQVPAVISTFQNSYEPCPLKETTSRIRTRRLLLLGRKIRRASLAGQ